MNYFDLRFCAAARRDAVTVMALLTCMTLSASNSWAGTVLGDPAIQREFFDGGTGSTWVYNGAFANPGAVVINWSFFNDGTAYTGCSIGQDTYVCFPGSTITPFLASRNDDNTFSVTGVGTTRANTLAGLQTNAFGLVEGSDVVGPNSTFGWRSGGPTDTGDYDFGVVQFDDSPSNGFYYFGERVQVEAGNALTILGGPSRSYSIQFETTETPEPCFFGSILGLAVVGLVKRRAIRRLTAPALQD